jgi:hypothetical protein
MKFPAASYEVSRRRIMDLCPPGRLQWLWVWIKRSAAPALKWARAALHKVNML